MTIDADDTASLQDAVRRAAQLRQPIVIAGGGTKAFFGRRVDGAALSVANHRGVLHYDPSELVITARAGTPLTELEQILAQQGQMLAFEPPGFGPRATLGGTIACNLSGPRRPYAGAVRDHVLGVRVLNGRGEVLRFGGEVMKNVAGYDVSRLMAGAMGTLGILLDISLKVLPRPAASVTLAFDCSMTEAIERMNRLAMTPIPISAACYDGHQMFVRLEGAETAVHAGWTRIGGEQWHDGEQFWRSVREQCHGFFRHEGTLWRLSVRSTAGIDELSGHWFYDWGGALRWYIGAAPAEQVRRVAVVAGGHATLFRSPVVTEDVFHPLPATMLALQQRLKQAFDPAGIFNRARIYAQF